MAANTVPLQESRVRLYRTMYSAVDGLKGVVQEKEKRAKRWRVRFYASLAAVVLLAGVVVGISSTTTTFYGISGDVYAYDTTVFTMTNQGHSVAGATVAAAGTTNSLVGAVDILVANAATANTALTQGQWVYQVTIAEAGIATFTSVTAYYKAELFIDGTSQSAVYLKNTVGDPLNAEGIVVKWGIGANLANSAAYVVKITQMAA